MLTYLGGHKFDTSRFLTALILQILSRVTGIAYNIDSSTKELKLMPRPQILIRGPKRCYEKVVPLKIFVVDIYRTYLLKFFLRCCKSLSYQIKMADSNRDNLEECSKLTNNTYANSKNAVRCQRRLLDKFSVR